MTWRCRWHWIDRAQQEYKSARTHTRASKETNKEMKSESERGERQRSRGLRWILKSQELCVCGSCKLACKMEIIRKHSPCSTTFNRNTRYAIDPNQKKTKKTSYLFFLNVLSQTSRKNKCTQAKQPTNERANKKSTFTRTHIRRQDRASTLKSVQNSLRVDTSFTKPKRLDSIKRKFRSRAMSESVIRRQYKILSISNMNVNRKERVLSTV